MNIDLHIATQEDVTLGLACNVKIKHSAWVFAKNAANAVVLHAIEGFATSMSASTCCTHAPHGTNFFLG